jgi:hypothetical protein
VIRVRFTVGILFVSGIILFLLVAGCADVNVQKKVGDFGTAFGASSEEQKAIDWFKTTYGDPTSNNDQPARFVEPLITTGIIKDKNLPVDKVTTFPQDGGSVYFFVIYDNFKKGDQITVTWTYLVNGKIVTEVQQQAGDDFGRFIVEFQKPDSGWGKGKQKIMVTGDGATESVDFTIGDSLQTTPLPYSPGSTTAVTTPTKTTAAVMTLAQRTIVGSAGTTYIATIPTTSSSSVDTKTDVNNCGKVGNVCASPENTIRQCVAGTCTYTCVPGYTYSNLNGKTLDPAIGCHYNTNIDPYNCGKFNNVCGGGVEPGYYDRCEGGVCTCAEKTTACSGKCRNLTSDSKNCGLCGVTCPPLMTCENKICKPSAEAICKDIPCPPLKHCVVQSGAPVCVVNADACKDLPPCPLLTHCDVSSLGVPVCVPGT